MSESVAIPRYQPRHIAKLGLWEVGGWRFKAYGIRLDAAAEGEPFLPDDLVSAAREAAADATPIMRERAHHGAGFAILHAGEAANWLMPYWWEHGSVCTHLRMTSSFADPPNFARVDDFGRACVWELQLIEHERRAWIENAMTRIGGIPAYLDRWMKDGAY